MHASIKQKSIARKRAKKKVTIGWREWASFPDLGIRGMKAKIDTGARTSAMHAWNIRLYEHEGKDWVEFEVHPMQRNNTERLICNAPVSGCRKIRSSSGHHEMRYVIKTSVEIGERRHDIEITLTNRDEMGFRLLLGRTALRGDYIIDPGRSYLTGKEYKRAQRAELERNLP